MTKIIIEGIIGWHVTPDDIRNQLKDAKEVRVEIASPGGFVDDAFLIYNILKDHPGGVDVHLNGLVGSAATYIAMVAQEHGGRVTGAANSVFIIHNISGFVWGDYRAFEKAAKEFKKWNNLLSQVYQKKTKAGIKQVRQWMDDETYWFGKKIQAVGFADEIEGEEEEEENEIAVKQARAMFEIAQHEINPETAASEYKKRLVAFYDMCGQNIGNKRIAEIDELAAIVGDDLKARMSNKPAMNNKENAIIKVENTGLEDKEDEMDLEKLKAEHPALFNQVMDMGREEGRNEERQRVTAHLIRGQGCDNIDLAIENIDNDKELTPDVIAKYDVEASKKRELDSRKDADIGVTQTQARTNEQKELEEYKAEMGGDASEQS